MIYEEKVHLWLEEKYEAAYIRSPWIVFTDEARAGRWCQPDGLLLDVKRGRVTIIEAKYAHTSRAWFQLFKLYKPVVETLFPKPSWEVVCIEIVKWFDPASVTPEPAFMRENVHDAVGNKFCVHIWKPR